MTNDIDVSKFDSVDEIDRQIQALRKRKQHLAPNKWVTMVHNQVVLTLRAVKRAMDDDQFDDNRKRIEKELGMISVDNYVEQAQKQDKPLRRGLKTKNKPST